MNKVIREEDIYKEAKKMLESLWEIVVPQLRDKNLWDQENNRPKDVVASDFRAMDGTYVEMKVDPSMAVHLKRLKKEISLNPRSDGSGEYEVDRLGRVCSNEKAKEIFEVTNEMIRSGKGVSFRLIPESTKNAGDLIHAFEHPYCVTGHRETLKNMGAQEARAELGLDPL